MLKTFVCSLIRDDQGQDLIEHAMIAGLISILSLVASNIVRGL
jgi:Flp pilus assembly pilin Flp